MHFRLLLALCGAVLLTGCGGAEGDGAITGVDRPSSAQTLPDVELRGAEDEPATLEDLKGEPLLVNLWATWCVPCVKELPTLEALSKRPGAPRVIAISQDMAARATVDSFLASKKIGELEVWHDPEMALSGALSVQVLPTTILYGVDGRERWRYTGDLDWTGAEAAKLLEEAR